MRSKIKDSRMWQAVDRNRLDVGAILLLFAGAFALYARTVTPGVLDADGGEFQTNIYRLGVSHTGYPLYFLLAKMWTLLVPAGTIAYRANLFSSLIGAAVVALLYPTIRVLARSRGAALFTAVFFGVSRVEWSQALIPDVYTLNSFFIVLVMLVAVLYRTRRLSPAWLAFAFGLSLTHHRTMMWLAPAVGVWLLLGEGWSLFRPRRLLTVALAFLLPLLLYVYIPMRGDSDVGVEYHATGFTQMILASNASVWLRFGPPGFIWERISTVYLPLLIEQFTLIGFLFGLFGIVALALGRTPRGWPATLSPRHVLLFIGLAHLVETAFAVVFWVVDSEIFFIPSYLTFLFCVGIGLAFAFDGLDSAAHRLVLANRSRYRLTLVPLFVLALLCLSVWLGWTNFPRVDRSWDDEADTRWQEILAQPIERGAWIVGNWEDLTPFEYYRYVEGRRTDLARYKVTIFKDQLKLAPQGDISAWVDQRLAAGQRVYFTRHPADTETLGAVAQRFDMVEIASLWSARARDERTIAGPDPVTNDLSGVTDGKLSLFAFTSPRTFFAGDLITLEFGWRARSGSEKEYAYALAITDAAGNQWARRDGLRLDSRSARSLAPNDPQAQLWTAPAKPASGDQVMLTTEGIFLPPDIPPGDYALALAVYDAGRPAPDVTGEGQGVVLRRIHVSGGVNNLPLEAYHIPVSTNIVLGNARLVGYGLTGSYKTGDRIEVQTWWQGLDGSSAVEIGLVDAHGAASTLARDSLPVSPVDPVDPRRIIRLRSLLQLPPMAAAGRATLTVKWSGQQSNLATLELVPGNRLFSSPSVQYSQRARLGSDVEFLGYNLDKGTYRAGDQAGVTLYWHDLQSLSSSYKVFVHLLNESGTLVAQQDGIPHGGDLPTDHWLAGEFIPDSYRLNLPADLSPGAYRFEIGMYDPESGARLPATDAEGRTLEGNRILLETALQVTR